MKARQNLEVMEKRVICGEARGQGLRDLVAKPATRQ